MGDGVNIAARLEGIAKPGAICLSEDAYRQVKGRLDLEGQRSRPDPAQEHRRADAGLFAGGRRAGRRRRSRRPAHRRNPRRRACREGAQCSRCRLSRSPSCSPLAPPPGISLGANRSAPVASTPPRRGRASLHRRAAVHQSFRRSEPGLFRRRHYRESHHRPLAPQRLLRHRPQHRLHFKGKNVDAKEIGKELGVRYVLEGSVQRDQNQVRVNAQLIDADDRRSSVGRALR